MDKAFVTDGQSSHRPLRRLARRAVLSFVFVLAVFFPVWGFTPAEYGQTNAADFIPEENDDVAAQSFQRLLDENPDDFRALLEIIDALYRNDEEEEASTLFFRLLRIHEDNPTALFDLGKTARILGRSYEAANALLFALDGRDKLAAREIAEAEGMLGELYEEGEAVRVMEQREDFDTEARFFAQRYEQNPQDAVALARRGLARQKQYRFEDALEDLIGAQKLGLTDLSLRSTVQRARVDLERFNYMATQGGHDIAHEFLYYDVREQLQAYDRQEDWKGQERYLGSVMTRAQVRSYAAIQRAYLRISFGDLEGAEEDFAVARQSELAEESRADIERGELAIGELRNARSGIVTDASPTGLFEIVSRPAFMGKMPSAPWFGASVKLRLAEGLIAIRAFQPLEIVLEQLRRMNLSEIEFARYQACLGEVEWVRKNYDEAIALFQFALKWPMRFSVQSTILFRFASYYADRGERETALDYARRSVELTPTRVYAQRRIGKFLIGMGELDEGFAHLQKALELSRNLQLQCDIYEDIMEAYKSLGERERFIETAEKFVATAERLKPPLPAALEGMADYYRGEIHRARGDEDRAYEYYERASRLVVSPGIRARLLMDLAQTDAMRGNVELAAARARQAAAIFPDRSSKQREAEIFIQGLAAAGMALDGDPGLADEKTALGEYAILANAAAGGGDRDAYLRYARRYVETATGAESTLSSFERGLAEFYRAEMAYAEGDAETAYAAYENARLILTDENRLAALLMNMARIDAQRRHLDLAAMHAGQSAALRPAGRPEYLEYATRYRDAVAARVDAAGDEERGLAAYYAGDLHAEAGEVELAAMEYERASVLLTDKRLLADTHMKLAELERQKGATETAIARAERAADILPDDPETLLRTGKFLLASGLPDRALPYFRRWLEATSIVDRNPAELFPLAEAFQERGETTKAFAVVRLVMQTDFVDDALENTEGLLAYYKGRMYDTRGETGPALAAYEHAAGFLRDGVRLSGVYMRMAELHSRMDNPDEAAVYVRRAAEASPGIPRTLRDVGYFFLRRGDMDDARAYLDRFIAMTPAPEEQASVFAALAGAYGKAGDMNEYAHAIERYEAAIRMNGRVPSQDEEARLAMLQADLHTRRGDSDQAFLAYERAVRFVVNQYQLAGVYFRMATHLAERGGIPEAIDYMERSVACLPGVPWKLRQAGGFYGDIGMPEKMLEYYRRALENSDTPESRASSLAALASAYKGLGDQESFLAHAREFVLLQTERDGVLDAAERGLRYFYQAEILAAEGDADAAYSYYERAARLLPAPGRRSGILYQLAQFHAARGERELAADLMERSVGELPDAPWKHRQAGGFYGDIGMTDRMLEHYRRAVDLSSTPTDLTASLAALASAYKDLGDTENFLFHARRYVAIQTGRDSELNDDERGRRYFYQAEILMAEGDPEAAHTDYEHAAQLLANPARRSDILYRMALFRAERGDREGAVALMERSLAESPEAPRRLRQAAALYGDLGMPEKMLEYHRRAVDISTTPEDTAASLAALANAYKSLGDTENFLLHGRRYIDIQTDRDGMLGDEERGLRHLYQGEMHSAAGDFEAAYNEYEHAIEWLANAARRSDILYQMARYRAEQGETERAAELMERSVAELPDASRKHRQAGGFYNGIGMPEKMLEHYHLALEHAVAPADVAASLASLANAYKGFDDQENFLFYARRYVAFQNEREDAPTDDDRGYSYYYQAEIRMTEGDSEGAYADYERALQFITNPGRRSSVLHQMALYHAGHGDQEQAVRFMEQSAAELPDTSWKLRQAAGFYARLNLTEKAVESYRKALAVASAPSDRDSALLSLAELYKNSGDRARYLEYTREYLRILESDSDLGDEQIGLWHYYRGEVFLAEDRLEYAISEYEQALRHTLADSRRIDLNLRAAQYYGEQGDSERFYHHIDEALAVMPQQIRTLRRIAGIFNGLEMYDWESYFFQQALAIAPTFREQAPLYAAMASSAKARGDEEGYLDHTVQYNTLILEHWDEATNAEKGMGEYYRGEIHAAGRRNEQAYEAYLRAARLLEDKGRLSETYLKLAGYDIENGNRESAAHHALQAAGTEPDKGYRVSAAARILNSLRRYDDAAAILRTAIAMDPLGDAASLGNDYLHKYLAETYVEGIDKQEGLAINAAYIDRLIERLHGGDPQNLNERFLDEWWDARRRQTRWAKNWGSFESRLSYSRDKDGDYILGTYTELVANIRFPNGFKAKVSGEIGGTLKGHHTGKTRSATTGEWRKWESDSYLRDTLHGIVGFRVSLFPRIAKLAPLDFRADYRFGLVRNSDDDFRLRLKWDRSEGLSPRLRGNFWLYEKEENTLTYSVTNNDFTSEGTIRRGLTYSPGWDRNLVIAPYAFMEYNYAGKDATDKWGLSTGPGLIVRKFHWEDRHHAPRAYLEFNIRYRFGLSNGEQDALACSLVYKF